MTKETEALKQALEALEHAAYCVQNNYCPDKMGHDWDDTITAIKEALARPPLPAQEPAIQQQLDRAFKRYLNDCDYNAIVPSVAGAFHFAWQEALAQPEQIDPNQWAFDNGLEST